MTKIEHQRLLETFWVAASTATEQSRIDLLRDLARLPVVKPSHRKERLRPTEGVTHCWACRAPFDDLEWHHIIPVKCGGRSIRFNFVALCVGCHQRVHEGAAHRWLQTVVKRVREVVRRTTKPQRMQPSPEPEHEWKQPEPECRPDDGMDNIRSYFAVENAIAEERWQQEQEEEAERTGDFSYIENEAERAFAEERWAERQAERDESDE